VSSIVWRFGIRFRVEGLSEVHEIIPAFCISLAAYLVISKLTPGSRPARAHLDKLFDGKSEHTA